MGMKWTEEQSKVITLRDRNILVSAAAGSGKTAVLVQRILSKIMDPDRPVASDHDVYQGCSGRDEGANLQCDRSGTVRKPGQ